LTFGKTACLGTALCFYAAAALVYAPVISDHPFAYDEADYMWAGKQGVWANYSDEHGISFVEFVRRGLELSRDAGQRQSFSEYIRATGDIEFYRHYHGPMYAYWLALLQHAGVRQENVFRGASLALHFATATLILSGMWALFPSLPPVAGLAACTLFVFDRAAMTAGTAITQHVLFTFFSVASLLACSMFLRRLEPRWFYAALALIAWSICTVETSVLLLGALGLAMLVEHGRVREKWPTIKAFAGLLLRGAGVFLLAVLIVWPLGLLKLGAAEGYLTLIYFALSRKTYTTQGPLALWREMFQSSPWEFSLLIPGVAGAFALSRRFAQWRELLPWLAFIALFMLVSLKMTVPYQYYYAPLTAAFAVATGVTFGILWNRWPPAGHAALALAVVASAVGTTLVTRQAFRDAKAAKPSNAAVLRLIEETPALERGRLYVPYQMVPMLHYYRPEIRTVGYDFDFPVPQLADGILSRDADSIMFCESSFCDALERAAPGFAAQKTLLDRPGPNGQPFYLVQIRNSGAYKK
jgi:hypothetical protein